MIRDKVHIFLDSGRTFTFKDATIAESNESVIVIEYTAMSDGLQKRATFYVANVAGISVTVQDVNKGPLI